MVGVVNPHVARLALYQPFDAHFARLYAEYVDTNPSDDLATKASSFVSKVIDEPRTRMVVLTGDAGHGKTHLCGQVLGRLGVNDVKFALAEHCDGLHDLATLPSGRALRVIKDLSELTPQVARPRLTQLIEDSGVVSVVCANEGRLRQVLSGGDASTLAPIESSLRSVLDTGTTSADDRVHVIDMNHQSVAARGDGSLIRQLFQKWLDDRRKWGTCDGCPSKDRCPILENRRLLTEPSLSASRRAALELLLRVAEQTGHVVTIRELLIFAAHTITGGLTCADVHERVAKHTQDRWQAEFLFHQVAFGTQLKAADRQRLRVFRAMSMLDPGQRAIRAADDALVGLEEQPATKFIDVLSLPQAPAARNTAQRQRDADEMRRRYQYLRRMAFFDALENTTAGLAERIGLRHYDMFELLFEDPGPNELMRLRDLVLRGLQAIQGLRGHAAPGAFVVVDPAFAGTRSRASVVAVEVPNANVTLFGQTAWWRAQGNEPNLNDVVDWVDRKMYIRLQRPNGAEGMIEALVSLDCRQFEFVSRASTGLSAEAFFQADVRRLTAQLAKITERPQPTYKITVIVDGRPAQIVIDMGFIEAAVS